MIFDTFMVGGADELDMLECRLLELEGVAGLVHVAVEADVDHQGHAKPYAVSESLDRFAPWKERLVVVRASGLPTVADDPGAWAREHAQREWCGQGLVDVGCENGDVVLHGDLDEVPRSVVARNVRPAAGSLLAFAMRGHFFAVDWLYPHPWMGTVAARAADVRSFAVLRDTRNVAPRLPDAGWHLSWLGGPAANRRKLGAFCHPEAEAQIDYGLSGGRNAFLESGIHVDGTVMAPVDVDGSWPRYVWERRCPESWFRPR